MAAKIVPIHKNSIGPIESDVPIPKEPGKGPTPLYPFRLLKVGQSFTTPMEMRKRVAVAAANYSKRHPPYKFTSTVDGDRVRIWRIR